MINIPDHVVRKAEIEAWERISQEIERTQQNKEDCQRELTGEAKYLTCICPVCGEPHIEEIAIEHYESKYSWKINNKYALFCFQHRVKRWRNQ